MKAPTFFCQLFMLSPALTIGCVTASASFFATTAAQAQATSETPRPAAEDERLAAPAASAPADGSAVVGGSTTVEPATVSRPTQGAPERPPFVVPEPSARAQRPSTSFVFRGFVGAGFAGYKSRAVSGDENHLFAEGAAAASGGWALLQKDSTTLVASAEVLFAHSFEGSVGARAAGNLVAGGIVLSTYLNQFEIGLGGYLVSRASAARELNLTQSHLNGGVGASFFKDFRSASNFSWGVGLKVLMLPTNSYDGSDGQKHVHFSDGLGMVGLSASWR